MVQVCLCSKGTGVNMKGRDYTETLQRVAIQSPHNLHIVNPNPETQNSSFDFLFALSLYNPILL